MTIAAKRVDREFVLLDSAGPIGVEITETPEWDLIRMRAVDGEMRGRIRRAIPWRRPEFAVLSEDERRAYFVGRQCAVEGGERVPFDYGDEGRVLAWLTGYDDGEDLVARGDSMVESLRRHPFPAGGKP